MHIQSIMPVNPLNLASNDIRMLELLKYLVSKDQLFVYDKLNL